MKARDLRVAGRIARLIDLMRGAALAGQPAPTNDELADALGYASGSGPAELLRDAEQRGLVVVDRGMIRRVVAAPDGSWRTAGDAGVPHWRGDREAIDWTPDLIKQLRALHAEGLSYAEIGARMGLSKNAVVGKAHRLNLPKRECPVPNPGRARPVLRGAAELRAAQEKHKQRVARAAPAREIGAAEGSRTRGAEAAGIVSLDAGRQPIPAGLAGDPTAGGSRGAAGAVCVPSSLALPPPEAPGPSAGVFSGGVPAVGCRWPMWGDAERATHRYCAAPQRLRADGTRAPYCAHHALVAFRPHEARLPQASVVTGRTFAWGGSAA